MRLAHKTHYLFWLLIATASLTSACNSCAKIEPGRGQEPSQPVPPIVSELPFSTKEPPVYQAEIVISISGDAGNIEQRYFTARDGEKRRTDHQLSGKETLSVIDLPEGKHTVLISHKKCAAEERYSAGNTIPAGSEPFNEFLTNGWLSEKTASSFEDLDKENVEGKTLAKYRVHFEKTNGVENISEAIVWVDAELGMPVKTEFYTLKDGQKTSVITTEFRNLKLNVEPDTFDKPEGCQNISAKEMQKILWQERLNAE